MKTHPSETELALFAGGDCGLVSRLQLKRHVRRCSECSGTVTEFANLRSEVTAQGWSDVEIPATDWDRLAAEMRANIHLGLEAGACVRETVPEQFWNPRLAVAFASLLLLVGAGFALRVPSVVPVTVAQTGKGSAVESTRSGLELRTGSSSMTLLNRHGSAADQTVSAQGVIRASYIDAGGVTFNYVYLE